MKLTLIFLLTALLQVNAGSFAQQVSLTEKRVGLEQVFREIKRQTDYDIFYNLDMLQQTQPISISVRNAPVRQVLDICFRNQPLSYYIEGKTIIIRQKPAATTLTGAASRQTSVSGRVTDQAGSALPGISIRVKGSTNGSVTDAEGRFRITAATGSVLVFTSIGYQSKEVTFSGQPELNVQLEEDRQALNDVVVVGYGTQRKASVVGAVDQVRAAQIEDRPVGNVMQALQGTAPSLVIQQRSMNPNDNTMNINLRGISTFGNNSPLLVIDGIINEDVGAMNNLNPNDIESVSILKDAGSAAIYGSRSANGVILITTKKGKKGMKPTVRLSALAGSQNPEILVKPLKGYQNALLRNDSYVNSGANPIYSSEQIRQFATGDSEYFLKGILKNGFQQNHNISVQGGSDNSTYLVSLGYYDQRSNFKGPDFGLRRYNLRTNLTTDIGKLKLSAIMWYDRNDGKSFQGDNGFLIANSSRLPVYNNYVLKGENGRYYNNDVLTNGNPLMDLEQGGFIQQNNDHFQGSLNAEIEIFKGLKARGIASLDLRPENRLIRRFYHPLYNLSGDETPVNIQNSAQYSIEDYNGKSTLLNLQALLDYNRSFGKHNVYGLAAFSNESYRQRRFELRQQLVDPVLGIPTTGTIFDKTSYNTVGGTTERSIYSWFGRAGYNLADRYLFEANFRYDGSSKFARSNRWGFFPSVSLGWRLSEETFFRFWKDKLGDLKIRGSYGQLGNQAVDDYQTFTTYDIYQDQYGFNNVSLPGTGYTFGNPDLKWETNTTFNIGADATFLSGKLTASFDYFRKNTKDILLTPQTPLVLGGAVPRANLGAMVNNGWELTLNYQLRHSDFVHNFGVNLADSWNKVTRFEGDEQISKSDEIERIIRVGLPLYSYFGYKRAGLFRNADEIKESALPIGVSPSPGDVKYVDRNGDGIIDDNDRFVLGHAFPRLTFGFNYDIQWKGFDLNMLWQGVGKRDMALRGETIEPFHGGYSFVMFEHQLDYWTPGNPDAYWPRLTSPGTASTSNNYGKGSDFNIFDASYIRLKNIQVGYTLPTAMSSKAGMRKVRLFVSGQNLLTISKNTFIDPESTEFGSSMNAGGANSARNYPLLKYIGAGLDIEF
ncbi:SusC/RagA family TonB-linked outer membrane protein [Pedobacter yulinensis]|uniref:SusC/RagA family TonB-linked outer membrane protein n=1 Tax=Pedobacter yulinensis TaxID=2126353 RepID=A0A2T3HMQ5_9SPHI|nr:TonB-dependent receptor [Pedobacter yulinensis]PST83730.1 SusC/RagA family TonB-linked outer membrane protein [Pedobacter yulinensis]